MPDTVLPPVTFPAAKPAPPTGAMPGQTVGVFYGQLSGLLRAGMPMPRALYTLAQDSDAPAFKAALERAAKAMESGVSAEDAFGAEGRELGGVLGQVVAASAATGKMPALLAELSSWTLSQDRIRRQIVDALIYPYSVLTLASLLCSMFLVGARVMGLFENTEFEFDSGGGPTEQRFLFPYFSTAMSQLVIGGVLGACLFFPILNGLSKWIGALRRWRESLLVRLPVAGAICRPLALSRLCGAIAILMKAGRPFHEAVAAAGPLTGYAPYAEAAQRAAEQLKAGANQADAFTGARLFPASFRFILASAQQRGDIPEAFAQLSELYQAEAEGRGRIVALLAPPAFLILVGGVIAFALFGILNPLIVVMERIGR